MALYHKWDVKNDFAYVHQFFSLISDILCSVIYIVLLLLIYEKPNVFFVNLCKNLILSLLSYGKT